MKLTVLCCSCSVRWLACLAAGDRSLPRASARKLVPAKSDSWAVRHCSVTMSWTGGALAGSLSFGSSSGSCHGAKWSGTTWTSSGSTNQTAALPSWCRTSRAGAALAREGTSSRTRCGARSASGRARSGPDTASSGGPACSRRRSTSWRADWSCSHSSRSWPAGYASGSKRQTATEAGGGALEVPSVPRLARTGDRGLCCCSCARM
mmetsp:Transcript_33103/g.103223  ORF Transcript_33103/g.103223 Transcript_33103/m.103223 type:complete len:206 (+) Transcript_33103:1033-1650(+)